MPGNTKSLIHALRIALLLVVLVFTPACAPGPSAVPTFTPFAPTSPTVTSVPITESAPATPTDTVQALSPPTAVDTGWQAEYFSNETWQGPATLTRVDPEPVFDWQFASPADGIPVDFFTVRWTRCLDLEARYYNFTVTGDDYVKVLVDDIPVVETTTFRDTPVPFAVSAGSHCIKVEYREFIGGAFLSFSFQPGEALSLDDPANPWQAEYFNNTEFLGPPTFTRNDLAPQFDWQAGNAAPGMPVDGFTVRWTRCLDMEGREYTFSAHADEYVRVLLDDVQVLEAPLSVNAETPVPVSPGPHCIKVEYREDAGTANIFFDFQ
jgi:hypothetical protein